MKPTKQMRTKGFTLIELMVVVAIIGILASVAYPSYIEYVKKGHRAKAQTVLLEAAQYMQRFYAANNSYNQNLSAAPLMIGTVRSAVSNSSNMPYTLDFATDSLTSSGYTLVATTITTGVMNGDKCGNFTIDQTGFKSIVRPNGSTATVQDCWK
jgi:type IV pilus assembly protein PilE